MPGLKGMRGPMDPICHQGLKRSLILPGSYDGLVVSAVTGSTGVLGAVPARNICMKFLYAPFVCVDQI